MWEYSLVIQDNIGLSEQSDDDCHAVTIEHPGRFFPNRDFVNFSGFFPVNVNGLISDF